MEVAVFYLETIDVKVTVIAMPKTEKQNWSHAKMEVAHIY